MRALVHDALSIYTVDQQRLAELSPDLILTQDLCRVCAVSLSDVQAAVARLASAQPRADREPATDALEPRVGRRRDRGAGARTTGTRGRVARSARSSHGIDRRARWQGAFATSRGKRRMAGTFDARGDLDARTDRACGWGSLASARASPRRPFRRVNSPHSARTWC